MKSIKHQYENSEVNIKVLPHSYLLMFDVMTLLTIPMSLNGKAGTNLVSYHNFQER